MKDKKIIKSDKRDVKYLYMLEKCLHNLLKKESNKSYMACVGETINKTIVFEILNYYVNYNVEIGIINSIILCHGLISNKHKTALKYALLRYNTKHLIDYNDIKDEIFSQNQGSTKLNLSIYIDSFRLQENKIISIYDSKNEKFITGTFKELLNLTIHKRESEIWVGNEVQIN